MTTATQHPPQTHHDDGSRPGGPGDSFDDLASFDRDARPETIMTQRLDTLGDGDYDFEITEAKIDRTGKDHDGDRLCRATLCVNGGRSVEHTWWLNRQEAMNAFLADLCTLGFDADKWGGSSGRSLAAEIPKAVARLAGIKFRGTKRSSDPARSKDGKTTYHNLFINAVIQGRPMPGSAPAAPNGVAPPPPTSAPPARAELFWLLDSTTNQPFKEPVPRHAVQYAVNAQKDAARVLVCVPGGKDGWVSANKLGFAVEPF